MILTKTIKLKKTMENNSNSKLYLQIILLIGFD